MVLKWVQLFRILYFCYLSVVRRPFLHLMQLAVAFFFGQLNLFCVFSSPRPMILSDGPPNGCIFSKRIRGAAVFFSSQAALFNTQNEIHAYKMPSAAPFHAKASQSIRRPPIGPLKATLPALNRPSSRHLFRRGASLFTRPFSRARRHFTRARLFCIYFQLKSNPGPWPGLDLI